MVTLCGMKLDIKDLKKLEEKLNNKYNSNIFFDDQIYIRKIEIFPIVESYISEVLKILTDMGYSRNKLLWKYIKYILMLHRQKMGPHVFKYKFNIKKVLTFAINKRNLHKQENFNQQILIQIIENVNFVFKLMMINSIHSKSKNIVLSREGDLYKKLLKNTSDYINCYFKGSVIKLNKKEIIPDYIFNFIAFAQNTKTKNHYYKIIKKANANQYMKLNINCQKIDKDIFFILCEVYQTALGFIEIRKSIKPILEILSISPEDVSETGREKAELFSKFSPDDLPFYLSIIFSVYLEANYYDTRKLILTLLDYKIHGGTANKQSNENKKEFEDRISDFKKYTSEHKILLSYINHTYG